MCLDYELNYYELNRYNVYKNSVKLYNLCDIMPYVVSIDVWQYYSKVIYCNLKFKAL